VCPRSRFFPLLLVLGLGACELPTTHLPATRRATADAGTVDTRPADTKLVPADAGRDSPGDSGCQYRYVDLTVPNGDIMLVVDRSAVMNTLNNSTCSGCGTYWSTIVDTIQTLTSSKSNQFRWGLSLYPSPTDADACLVSATPEVAVGADTSNAIASALAATTPRGGAPTAMAIHQTQTVNYFGPLVYGPPRFIVLAMGSAPTCAGGDPAQEDFAATLTEIQRAFELVFVIGVGPDRSKFDQLAMAGTKVAAYSPGDTSYLLGALEGLARSFAGCNFVLPSTAVPGKTVNVLLDDVPLTAGATNGFLVTPDGTQVVLQGPSCFYIGTHASVTLKVGCDG
jgi:hypothetical protein